MAVQVGGSVGMGTISLSVLLSSLLSWTMFVASTMEVFMPGQINEPASQVVSNSPPGNPEKLR